MKFEKKIFKKGSHKAISTFLATSNQLSILFCLSTVTCYLNCLGINIAILPDFLLGIDLGSFKRIGSTYVLFNVRIQRTYSTYYSTYIKLTIWLFRSMRSQVFCRIAAQKIFLRVFMRCRNTFKLYFRKNSIAVALVWILRIFSEIIF